MEGPRSTVPEGQDEYRDYWVLTRRTATVPRTKVLNNLAWKVVRKGKEEKSEDEDGKESLSTLCATGVSSTRLGQPFLDNDFTAQQQISTPVSTCFPHRPILALTTSRTTNVRKARISEMDTPDAFLLPGQYQKRTSGAAVYWI